MSADQPSDIVTGKETDVLRATAEPVRTFDDDLTTLAATMHHTMMQADGIGLAAPQIGKPLRLFVVDPDALPNDLLQTIGKTINNTSVAAVANPVIIAENGEQAALEEGCLSLPGIAAAVPRAGTITLQGQNLHGQPFTATLSGFPARIIQHEVDHLNGTLIVDQGAVVPHDDSSNTEE